MSKYNRQGVRAWSRAVGALCALLAGGVACGSSPESDKFSAQTYDEYTEQLTNAVIGTPSGVITVSPTGVSTISAASAGAAGSAGASSGGSGGAAGSGTAGIGTAGISTGGSGTAGSGTAGSGTAGTSFGGSAGSSNGSDGFGFWHFDDCSPTSHFLIDSSGMGANAQQALKAKCVAGISGQGVQLASAKDIIQVPDEPQFTVGQHVGVAAWVKPNNVKGDQPIVIKRLNNKTAFSLGIHNGNIEMSVVLTTGKTVISRAPISAGVWTHVAGMFDGTFVFLFINGQQFGQTFGAGTVADVFAPIRIGATTQSQFLNGVVDEVFLTTQVISASTLTALSCINRPTTFTVNPASGGPVPADTNVHYDIAATNNDVGACGGKQVDVFFGSADVGISEAFDGNGPFQFANPGQTVTFGVNVSGSTDADPGTHILPFSLETFGGPPNFPFEFLNGQLSFTLSAPTGCFVTSKKELMITSTSVVDDPVRTAGSSDPLFGGSGGSGGFGGEAGAVGTAGTGTAGAGTGGASGSGGTSGGGGPVTAGVWSFGHLMREMAPTPEQAPAFTLALFQHWLSPQTVNGFTVAARPAMQQLLLDIWPKTANGDLDLDRSPLTLQAIVNRVDIRNLAEGTAGEGRFVFGVNGPINFQQFTVIVEYKLVAQTQQDVLDWANRWHALSSHPFPSEEYNAALEAVTRRFTDRGASPNDVNGSALFELRTNEIALSNNGQWELRSFQLSPSTGFLDETTVKETPDLGFNGTSTLADFVNLNATAIKAELPGDDRHIVPLSFEGAPFRAGSVFNNLIEWSAPGIQDPDARFHASLNTCNGCHGPESNTTFLMVTPRFPGSEATLSPFITGTQAFDQFTGQFRSLNDLARRRADLTSLVCATSGATAVAKK